MPCAAFGGSFAIAATTIAGTIKATMTTSQTGPERGRGKPQRIEKQQRGDQRDEEPPRHASTRQGGAQPEDEDAETEPEDDARHAAWRVGPVEPGVERAVDRGRDTQSDESHRDEDDEVADAPYAVAGA